ncbi:ependymin-related protein 1-like [Saccostrea echinata]|uniref:ependymin-related protein 1-like n=1 Tax=Saccostrea echinata TaxID=191078 RepID=UPI002A82B13F|nr:ependymin-related protein 1-like [Saccostrea echinata]
MLTLFIIVSVFVLSHQQCCFPSQWEGIQSGSMATVSPGPNPVPVFTSFSYLLSVDYSKHLLYLSGNVTTGGHTTQIKVIRDYSAKIQYVIDLGTNTCKKTVMTDKEVSCLGTNGDNATVVAKTYFGAGGQQLPFTVYKSVFNGYPSTVSVAEGCIPVGTTYHGNNEYGDSVIGSIGYHSITPGISDLSVFAVPANCVSAPLAGSVVG